ncbi:MAG TPA: hypothetical protein VG860_17920 [Terriglobia bacterium]|jgi:hypothetical protein|nr:hypothetical protein [Terriglobia bacterium]
MTVVLIHWNADEGRERARLLRRAGFQVLLEVDRHRGPQILKRLRDAPPKALVVSLDRLPMQGRDLAVALRAGRQTREIPLVFAGGEASKVERVRQVLRDAAYATWATVAKTVKRTIAHPPANPAIPGSNLAGYSGTPLAKKLGIKPNSFIALLQEPDLFVEILDPLPAGVQFSHRITPSTGVTIWFVRSAAELISQIDSVARQVVRAICCRLWIAWPKRTSPLASDVNETLIRTTALAAGLLDYKVAAIDADWSGLLFAPRRTPVGE